MASVNKQSVRGEVQKVKAEFDRLSQTGSMTAEVKTLMSALLLIVELMLSIPNHRRRQENGQGKTESIMLFPRTDLCGSLLPNLKLSANDGQQRLQPITRYSNGTGG